MTGWILGGVIVVDLVAGYLVTWWWNCRTLRRAERDLGRVLRRADRELRQAGIRIRP